MRNGVAPPLSFSKDPAAPTLPPRVAAGLAPASAVTAGCSHEAREPSDNPLVPGATSWLRIGRGHEESPLPPPAAPPRDDEEVDTSWLEPPDEDAPKRAGRTSTEVRRPSKTMGAVVPPKPAGPGGRTASHPPRPPCPPAQPASRAGRRWRCRPIGWSSTRRSRRRGRGRHAAASRTRAPCAPRGRTSRRRRRLRCRRRPCPTGRSASPGSPRPFRRRPPTPPARAVRCLLPSPAARTSPRRRHVRPATRAGRRAGNPRAMSGADLPPSLPCTPPRPRITEALGATLPYPP